MKVYGEGVDDDSQTAVCGCYGSLWPRPVVGDLTMSVFPGERVSMASLCAKRYGLRLSTHPPTNTHEHPPTPPRHVTHLAVVELAADEARAGDEQRGLEEVAQRQREEQVVRHPVGWVVGGWVGGWVHTREGEGGGWVRWWSHGGGGAAR
jgi:hypothetical protein